MLVTYTGLGVPMERGDERRILLVGKTLEQGVVLHIRPHSVVNIVVCKVWELCFEVLNDLIGVEDRMRHREVRRILQRQLQNLVAILLIKPPLLVEHYDLIPLQVFLALQVAECLQMTAKMSLNIVNFGQMISLKGAYSHFMKVIIFKI